MGCYNDDATKKQRPVDNIQTKIGGVKNHQHLNLN